MILSKLIICLYYIIKIKNFFSIIGLIDGNIQLFFTLLPVNGEFIVSAKRLIISSEFILQKTQEKTPLLQMKKCYLKNGFVDTYVKNIGLLTAPINLRYKVLKFNNL